MLFVQVKVHGPCWGTVTYDWVEVLVIWDFQLHIHVVLLDLVGHYLIRWAIVTHGDCHFKFQNRSWHAKSYRRLEWRFSFSPSDYGGPPHCFNDWVCNTTMKVTIKNMFKLNNILLSLWGVWPKKLWLWDTWALLWSTLPCLHTFRYFGFWSIWKLGSGITPLTPAFNITRWLIFQPFCQRTSMRKLYLLCFPWMEYMVICKFNEVDVVIGAGKKGVVCVCVWGGMRGWLL